MSYIIQIKYEGRETAYVSMDMFTLEHEIERLLLGEDDRFESINHAMADDFYNIYKIPFCEVIYSNCKRPEMYKKWFENMDTSKISVKVVEYDLLIRKIKISKLKK